MELSKPAQRVINSLKAGRQPAKNTPKYVLEGLEQASLIHWGGIDNNYNGWKLTK